MIKYPLYRYNMEMARATQSFRALPALAADQLQKLGRDISIARKRRRMSLSEMAERMMVNIKTVQRLEKGDPSVGVGIDIDHHSFRHFAQRHASALSGNGNVAAQLDRKS